MAIVSYKKFTQCAGALSLMLVFFVGCSKKKSNDSDEQPAEEPLVVQSSVQPAAQSSGQSGTGSYVPLPPVQAVKTGNLTAALTGLPAVLSKAAALNVGVTGTGVTHYKFSLLGDLACSSAVYGEWVPLADKITSSVGVDGAKHLCVIVMGQDEENGTIDIASLDYSWIKDATLPGSAIDSVVGFGPYVSNSSETVLSGTYSDNLSGVVTVGLSVQVGSGLCLNSGKSAFNAICPVWLPANLNAGSWSLEIGDSVFSGGTTYQFKSAATDGAGNMQTSFGSMTAVWDTTPPPAPAGLTVSGQSEKIALSWNAVASATSYIVIRKKESTVTWVPVQGTVYYPNYTLPGDHLVAAVTSGTVAEDEQVQVFKTYHYAVFAVDAAGNIGSAASGSADAFTPTTFAGVSYAVPTGTGRRISVYWNEFAPAGADLINMIYEVYASSTPGGQYFSVPTASVTGDAQMQYSVPGSYDDVYLVVRQRQPGGAVELNTYEFKMTFAANTAYKIASSHRFDGADPTDETYLKQAYGLANDRWGNTIFYSSYGMLSVLCAEVTAGPYCLNRVAGKVYFLAGGDGYGDAGNDVVAHGSPMGLVYGLATDSAGNIFIADNTYFKVRMICYNVRTPGLCYGRKEGYLYTIAGKGLTGDGLDNLPAIQEFIGNPNDVAVDGLGNVYIADRSYFRIRLICADTSSGVCAGRTRENIYRLYGAGTAADTADNTSGANPTGLTYAIDVDTNGNIYFSDYTYFRIRAVCQATGPGNGFCTGKIAGNTYRVVGTGSNGNAGNNMAASSEPTGRSFGLRLDHVKNIWYSDIDQRYLRVVCQDVSAPGFCNGRTAGNIYRAAGTGSNIDGPSDVDAMSGAIGDPRDIGVTANGNIMIADSVRLRVRILCNDNVTGDFCSGRTPGNTYHYIGRGVLATASSGGAQDGLPAISVAFGLMRGNAVDAFGNIFVAELVGNRVKLICNDLTPAYCIDRKQGRVYVVAGDGTAGNGGDDVNPMTNPIGDPGAIAIDSKGNIFFSDVSYPRIRVICKDVVAAGFCNGKSANYMYVFSGTGAAGNGADNSPAPLTTMGASYGIAFDGADNLYVADQTYRRIRVICDNVSAVGFCNGKTRGNIYRYGATGTSADGDFGARAGVDVGSIYDLKLDSGGNVYFIDYTYRRVRAICADNITGFCSGKIPGFMYRVAGTGVVADGGDNIDATTSAMGTPYGLSVSPSGNIHVSDSYYRIRTICFETVSAGFCRYKTSGNIYRRAGTGAALDEGSQVSGNLSRTGIHVISSLTMTPNGGLIWSDSYLTMRFLTP